LAEQPVFAFLWRTKATEQNVCRALSRTFQEAWSRAIGMPPAVNPAFFARTGGVVVQYMYRFLAATDRVLPWYLEQHGRGIEESCRLSSDLQWDRS
jgi:hypothetical protein